MPTSATPHPHPHPSKAAGNRLRSLYAATGGAPGVFSSKVADYLASRPDYPATLYDRLITGGGLAAGARIADVGTGTGLFARGLLERGHRVVGIEPNAPMRAAADHLFAGWPGWTSLSGTAEALPLADRSVDLVCAAHAFHWFEVDRARAECLRVLTPAGMVALVWNDRLAGDPLHIELTRLLDRHGGERRSALIEQETRGDLDGFFGRPAPQPVSFAHEHRLGEAGLLALVFSRSYMPARDSAEGERAAEEIRRVYRRFADQDALTVHYTTVAYIGRPAATP